MLGKGSVHRLCPATNLSSCPLSLTGWGVGRVVSESLAEVVGLLKETKCVSLDAGIGYHSG